MRILNLILIVGLIVLCLNPDTVLCKSDQIPFRHRIGEPCQLEGIKWCVDYDRMYRTCVNGKYLDF